MLQSLLAAAVDTADTTMYRAAEEYRTKTVMNSLNPEWQAVCMILFTFSQHHRRSSLPADLPPSLPLLHGAGFFCLAHQEHHQIAGLKPTDRLTCTILDYERVGSDQPMGMVTIPVADMVDDLMNGTWFPVQVMQCLLFLLLLLQHLY